MMNFLGPLRKSLKSSPSKSSSTSGSSGSSTDAQPSTSAINGDVKGKKGSKKGSRVKVNGEVVVVKGENGAAGGAAAAPEIIDPARVELEEIRGRAKEVANESLNSTKRMAEYCEQAKDAGIKIIVSLDDQKEQLDRVQDSLTLMRKDLIQAETNLRGMNKCCGIFVNPFKKPNFKEDETLWKDAGDGVVADSVPRRPFSSTPQLSWPLNRSGSTSPHKSPNKTSGAAGGYIPKITDDEVEEQMEKNMDLVSSMLGNLRNMAIDMNTEIASQNKQMDIINDMTEQNNARIDDAIKKTHDLKRQ